MESKRDIRNGKRDTRITIAKALGIILVVLAHTDNAIPHMNSFIFEFHMPLFFICSGYFFSLRYLTHEGTFVGRRLKGLYLPFLEWALFFLVIHNFLFDIGIFNEQYGNAAGGVIHPYSWHEFQQRLWYIVFSMGGYDEFLGGTFWFFRALFVASLLYLLLFKVGVIIADRISRHHIVAMQSHWRLLRHSRLSTWIGAIICIILFALCMWKSAENLKIITIVQEGYRDLLGCFFFGIGFLLRPVLNKIPRGIVLDIIFFAIILAFTLLSPSAMSFRATWQKCLSMPIPAFCGFLLIYDISCRLDKLNERNIIRRFLVYCGDNTLIVFVLHITAFKLVSALKIMYYDLPWAEMSCHMTIHEHPDDLFWILYTIVGVGVPLIIHTLTGRRLTRSLTKPSLKGRM